MTQKSVSSSEAEQKKKIEEEIEAYLTKRAGAADTLEGVVHWWIMQQRMMESERLVKEAILSLCNKGLIEKRLLPDGTDMYYCKSSNQHTSPQGKGA